MDYPLCDQTVTVYRKTGSQISRQVVENCYLQLQDVQEAGITGSRQERKFLLVMPGQTQRVFAGDRIFDGVGPHVTDWASFIPVKVPGLVQAAYAQPYYMNGALCHVEAGRK